MRRLLILLVLVGFSTAYLLPTETLDLIYQATPTSVKIIGSDGRVIWSGNVIYPLIATDPAGRCLAIVNRPYVYEYVDTRYILLYSVFTEVELSPHIVETLAQYGIRIPQRIPVVLNLTIPLPPVILVALHKVSIVSLHAPYGYPHWGVNLGPKANVTAVATSCEYVVVGTIFGEIYVLRDGRVVDQFFLEVMPAKRPGPATPVDPPVTAIAIDRSGRWAFVGTIDGGIYRFRLPTEEELRTGRYNRQLTRVAKCGGAVYGLYVNMSGQPIALCFNKTDRPYVRVYPYNLTFMDPVLLTYGLDTPRIVSAISQDTRWLYLAVGSEVVGLRDGKVAWRYTMPAKPTAIAASWNGTVVAVGTLAGHLYVFKNGVPIIKTDPVSTQLLMRAVEGNVTANFTVVQPTLQIRPVTSVVTSFDGQIIAYENWDRVSILYTARLPYRVEAPEECLPLEAAVIAEGSDVAYLYSLYRQGEMQLPYGRVRIMPLYRYMGDARCRPERNFTLTIFGDVEEPLVFRYIKQFRVYKQPPELIVGPDWAIGPTRYGARLTPPVQAEVDIEAIEVLRDRIRIERGTLIGLIRSMLDGWEVDGRFIEAGIGVVTVDVQKPTRIKAIYKVSLPKIYVERGQDAGVKLVNAVLYDSYGNIIDSGLEPRFDVYPVFIYARYVPILLVVAGYGATVNKTDQLWAEYGSTVVFEAPEYIDLGNGTRGVFVMWRETRDTSRVVTEVVKRPIRLTPVFERHYLVRVKPPARIEGVVGNETWVKEGAKIAVIAPPAIEERPGVRAAFKNWVINGVPNATLRAPRLELTVRRPMNISFELKRQYQVHLVTALGSVPPSVWVDEGDIVAITPTPTDMWAPPPLRFIFVGWRDVTTGVIYHYPQMPIAYGPMTLEAVWTIDPLPLVIIAAAVGGAVALIIFLRRRKLAKLMESVSE